MRYISDEKELRKISIYTNIKSVEEQLKKFFYKADIEEDPASSERIQIAVIDSSEPFSTKNTLNSEVIFDITGGYPNTKQRVYKGVNKASLAKADLWLEIITSVFSVEISADKLDLHGYIEELENYKKMDIKKYLLTEDMINDLAGFEELPKAKGNKQRFIYIVINGYLVFPVKTKELIINGMEWKYGIKAFQKTCKYMFDKTDNILGYVYEIKKEI